MQIYVYGKYATLYSLSTVFVYATHANVELSGKVTMELLGMKMQRIRRFFATSEALLGVIKGGPINRINANMMQLTRKAFKLQANTTERTEGYEAMYFVFCQTTHY